MNNWPQLDYLSWRETCSAPSLWIRSVAFLQNLIPLHVKIAVNDTQAFAESIFAIRCETFLHG